MAWLDLDFKVRYCSTRGGADEAAGAVSRLSAVAGTRGIRSGIVLMAIAAAIIGGTSLSGGRGTAIGAVIGIVIVQVILSGLSMFGVDATWNTFAIGAVLVLALALDRLIKVLRSRGAEPGPENPHG